MTSEDIAAVSQIDAACFEEPWPKNSFAYELTTDYSICMVATTPEMEVAAAIVVWLIADEAHIATIAVHPDAQGQGIGACLLAHALLAAHQRGAMTSMLEVRVSNLAAIASIIASVIMRLAFAKTITRTTTKMPSCLTWIKSIQTN